MRELIIKLDQVRRENVNLAGGKGANLGELLSHGFPVPLGFVVTAPAYEAFFRGLDLNEKIKGLDRLTPAELEQRCAGIRRLMDESELPADLAAAVMSAHAELESPPGRDLVCAVRSSATAEDLGEASFAGQHETYYYVQGDELLQMIKKCWASLWNPEAISYRHSQGIEHVSVNMAVVVQEMILSEVSGVTFTANPVTGSREEIVTESSWGMGAAIVDGRVTPDHWVMSRDGLKIREKRIACKRLMVPPILPEDSSERLIEVPYELRQKETLSPESARAAAEWALKAEQHFGAPQDVEWAMAGGRYYMLQSRPITILGGEDIGQGVKGKWVLFKPIVENFTDPLTPLTTDMFGMALNLFPGVKLIKGWAYVNLDLFKTIMPFNAPDQALAEFIYRLGGNPPPLKLSLLKLPLFLLLSLFFYLTQGIIYARSRRIPDDFMDEYRKVARKVDLDDSVGPEKSMFSLWTWPKLFSPIGHLVTLVNLASVRYMIGLDLLRKLVRRYLPELPADAESLLCSGSQGVLSAEMGRDIWSLAQEAKRRPRLRELLINNKPEKLLAKVWNVPEAEEFAAQLDRFLNKHGHRGLKEIELRSSRWEENPSPVLGMVRNYMLVDSDPHECERKVEEARKDIESQIRVKLERRPLERLGLRRRLIRYVAKRVKYFAKMRENSRYYHVMGLHVVRKKILRLEAQLLRQGRLKCKDDIFFLYRDELSRLSTGKLNWPDVENRIRERRLEHIRLSRITPPMAIGVEMTLAGPEAVVEPADENLLKGQPASPGQYTGLAHVILDPSMDLELKPGEVLVAPFTDPAWTPLFLTAGAAVVEIGSYLSHAGTVAREFGMPCVVDVPGCTSFIQTGYRVKVDGVNGLVRIVSQEEGSPKCPS